ncbi:MAG: hypothetical protein A3E78_00415 [Alphaproteobacteria bacterium RIFCSPHIGHO2_12_FULL_63_12]|nr:MAG: hypothetical protein A3E78_00415 [Alphaproteobacteria bacterium RIFCSPHIGHO2_12_FULL_63_12]
MSKEAPTPTIEEKSKKKAPITVIIGASLIVGGAAAAAVYFLAPDSLFPQSKSDGAALAGAEAELPTHANLKDKTHTTKSEINKSHENEEENDTELESEASERGGSQFHITGDIGVFSPPPIVVSITPVGRVRYLKLGYVVETSPEYREVFFQRENRIRDTLNIYLRAVNIGALEDPASMGRIREQISRRIALVVDPAPVHAVLITDFILS